jgi:putative Mg2+ transporter-C (MgtC) family protein
MNGDLTLNWEDYLRLALAMLMGAGIGFERELHDKPAGLKTIALVTLAGCLLSLISVRLGLLAGSDAGAVDISRLAAGVVTGIGFIGAGTIIQSRHHVQGVTTAAIIWLMSAIGMSLGAGFYGLAIATYIIGWVALSLDPLGAWLMGRLNLKQRVLRGEERQRAMEEGGPFGTAWADDEDGGGDAIKPLRPPHSQQSLQNRKSNDE